MKKIFLLLITAFTLSCCYNDNPSKSATELDKLPPATQTGAGTVGCLLDGKAIISGYYSNSTNCWYQFVNGGYYFCITFDNRDSKGIFRGLAINTNGLTISQGQTLELKDNVPGSPSGYYQYQSYPTFTDSIYKGKLKITKLDPVNYFVSGTFWYDVEDQEGVVHQIREGRFDMHYTN